MMKKTCIIYGGGGFIGSHICDYLIKSGRYNITVFDKLNFSRKNISHLGSEINVIEGDFNNEIDLKNSLKNVDYVIHLVSSTLPASSNKNPVYDVETNLISTLKLLNEVKENNVQKIIFISSGGTVYGIPEEIPIKENHPCRPICSYGIIKKTIEDYLYMYFKLFGFDYTVFRMSNPYGERQNPLVAQGVIPVFIRKAYKGETIEIWGDGSVTRDYIYIKDAARVIVDALTKKTEDKVFNLGTGAGVTLNEIISLVGKTTGLKAKVNYLQGREIDVHENVLDITKIKKTFGWKPEVSIEEGILNTYNYIKENY